MEHEWVGAVRQAELCLARLGGFNANESAHRSSKSKFTAKMTVVSR